MGIIRKLLRGSSGTLTDTNQGNISDSYAKLLENIYKWIGSKGTTIPSAENFDFVRKGYMDVPAVFEAIEMIKKSVAKCPVLIYEIKDENKANRSKSLRESDIVKSLTLKAQSMTEVDVPRIRELLEQPNDKQTWTEFINVITVMLLATGNALVYHISGDKRSRKVSEMWALPFAPVTGFKIVSGGMFNPVEGYRISLTSDSTKDFSADEITHFKLTNPLWSIDGSQLYGMSPLTAYVAQMARYQLGAETTNNLLNNGFKMGLISPKHKEDAFGQEQKEGLKKALVKALKSNESFARFIPAAIAMDYTPIGLDSTELGIIDITKSDREDIYSAFGIPRIKASTDNSTYNNQEQAGKDYVFNAVAPVCDLISDVLTKMICEPFMKSDGKKYRIELDYMSLPELSKDLKQISEWLVKSDWLTLNEKREVMGWGRLDMVGMDEVLVNKSTVTLGSVVNGSEDKKRVD